METIYIEIDGAAGGEEGNLFAADLARMYIMWAQKDKLKIKQIGSLPVLLKCSGENAYSFFAYEGGVHRVQRVPTTEKHGRIHTSTVTVNVYKDKPTEKIKVNKEDCTITSCRSSGKGGQHVNRTNSKVRVIHDPTGTVVECQEERSQHMNIEKAIKKIEDIINNKQQENNHNLYAANKKTQVGSGNRCEKIRTYNYPQNLVVDHRCNYKCSNLNDFMRGKNHKELYDILSRFYR